MSVRPLRIAMLVHSTNPRGGVAHAMALAEALVDLGHTVAVHAPDPALQGFPRPARCALVSVPATRVCEPGLAGLVQQRIADYADYFRPSAHDWDILHAHDGMSGNALARLRDEGRIDGFVRTVHHLDTFADPVVNALQTRSVTEAAGLACVSRHWRELLLQRFRRDATLVGNGVDLRRFQPRPDASDAAVREQYRLNGQHPLVLSIGGIEERKNTVRLLEAFLRLRRRHARARLLVVGGASLLDHSPAQKAFFALLETHGLRPSSRGPVTVTGAVPDHHVAPLLRAADVFAFPSTHEGFGLVTLEALACGTPVVTSRIPPFTEYLDESSCRMVQPDSVASIAAGLEAVLDPWLRATLRPSGFALARRMGWAVCAERQLALYRQVLADDAPPVASALPRPPPAAAPLAL